MQAEDFQFSNKFISDGPHNVENQRPELFRSSIILLKITSAPYMQKQSNSFHTQKETHISSKLFTKKTPKLPIYLKTTKENNDYIACNSHPSPVVETPNSA